MSTKNMEIILKTVESQGHRIEELEQLCAKLCHNQDLLLKDGKSTANKLDGLVDDFQHFKGLIFNGDMK